MASRIVRPSGEGNPRDASFGRYVSRAAFAAGAIYLIGSLVDLGTLWLGQRQPGIQWEFVAITNTVEAWPRLVLAVSLLYMAAHIRGSLSKATYRLLGLSLLAFGLIAIALGGLMMLNYLQVSGNLEGDAATFVRSAVVKTEILCALYAITLLPIGAMGVLAAPSSSASR